MGIFDIFKKSEPKKEPHREISEKEILEDLATFNEEKGDWESAFYFRNKNVIDGYEQKIVDGLVSAREAKSDAKALKCLYSAREQYEAYHAWCEKKKDGLRYFAAIDRVSADGDSRYKRLLEDIARLEYRPVIAEGILKKARDGILQSELTKQFDASPSEVRVVIKRLEEKGKISKEKSGKSYIIKTK